MLTSRKWIYRILRHALLFLTMVLLFTWLTHSKGDVRVPFMHSLLMVFSNALVFFAYGYLTIYLLVPRLLVRERFALFFLAFILLGFALSLLKFLFSDFLFYSTLSQHHLQAGVLTFPAMLANTKDMTFIVAVFAIVKFARDRYLLEINIRELEQKGLEAELKLLDHQMDPHVIFNNFNNLYSISINRPELLACTVGSIKYILNYLFLESKQFQVPLDKEVRMIEHYIGLEKLRYGEQLKISYSLEGEAGNLQVAPLILYPFVENCFVHGAGEALAGGWVEVTIRVMEGNLHFRAANSLRLSGEGSLLAGERTSLDNSLRRLELQYPNSHRLTIKEGLEDHVVELNLRL